MDYSHWDLYDEFEIYAAAILYTGNEPRKYELFGTNGFAGVSLRVADALILSAYRDQYQWCEDQGLCFDDPIQGKYAPGIVSYSHSSAGSHQACYSTVVTRDWLKKYFLSKNQRPEFLFHNERVITKVSAPQITYSTNWLEIIDAAIAEFFSPRPSVDAKKEVVVEWINNQAIHAGLQESDRIAEAIFTIIKPSDHNPRRRREKNS